MTVILGAFGSTGPWALLWMFAVLVLEASITTAQPCGTTKVIQPVPQLASTTTSRCSHDARVKSILMRDRVHFATIRCGTIHRPLCLRLMLVSLVSSISVSGLGSPLSSADKD